MGKTDQCAEYRLEAYKRVSNWPRKDGKAALLRFYRGERLTRDDAIKAYCYECVCGEDTAPCEAALCPFLDFCQWGKAYKALA